MVDCQRLGQSHGSFVPQLVTTKTAGRDTTGRRCFENIHTLVILDINLEHSKVNCDHVSLF